MHQKEQRFLLIDGIDFGQKYLVPYSQNLLGEENQAGIILIIIDIRSVFFTTRR